MIIFNKFSGYGSDGRRTYNFGGGGGGSPAPQNTTVNNSTLPAYLQPAVEQMIGTAQQQLYNYTTNPDGTMSPTSIKGYIPYGATVQIGADGNPVYGANGNPIYTNSAADQAQAAVAGFSPLQEQYQNSVANLQMPGQFQQATNATNQAINQAQNAQYGYGNANYLQANAPQLQNYQMQGPADVQGANAQAAGLGKTPTAQAAQFQGPSQVNASQVNAPSLQNLSMRAAGNVSGPNLQNYQMGNAQQVGTQDYTGQNVQNYMSPYMQNVVNTQMQEANRNYDISGTQSNAQATQAGAFGGGRNAIMQAENERNRNTALNQIQATGAQSAFQNAQQQFNQQQQANLQAQQANQQAGLTVGQQNLGSLLQTQGLGAQLGQQAALSNQANQQQANLQNLSAGLQTQNLGAQSSLQAQQANQQARLQAGLANQQMGYNTGLQNAQLRQQTGLANQQMQGQYGLANAGYQQQANLQNAQLGQQANLANQQMAYNTNNANLQSLLGTQQLGSGQNLQSQLANQQGYQNAQQLNAQQQQFGANYNLQNLQQQLAGAGQLGQLGTNSLAGIASILGLQQGAGAQQQAQAQNYINQAIQNYAQQQQYPQQQIQYFSNLIHGLPGSTTTTQSYQAAPSTVSQLGGIGMLGAGMYGLAKAKGGIIKSMAKGGAVRYDVGGSVDATLNEMDDAHLQEIVKTSPSQTIRQEAAKILGERAMEKQAMGKGVTQAPAAPMQMASGGIVAFGDPDLNPNEDQQVKDKGLSFDERLAAAGKTKEKTKVPKSALFGSAMPQFTGIDTALNQYAPQDESKNGVVNPKAAAFNANVPGAGPTFDPTAGGNPAVAAIANKGLGNTPQAGSAPQAASQAPVGDTLSNVDTFYKRMKELQGEPEDRKAMAEQFKSDRAEAKEQKQKDMWLSLVKAGSAAMASTSPYAAVGLGKAGEAGVEGMQYANKAYNQALKDAQTGELDLAKLNNSDRTNLLHYAVTGAVSDSNMRTKMAELKEIAATRAAGAGQANLARQDAAITARAKLILGNNPMPTEQDVEKAIGIATQQVTGKGVSGGLPQGVKVTKVG